MDQHALRDQAAADLTPQAQFLADSRAAKLEAEIASLRARYQAAMTACERERERADSLIELAGITAKPMSTGRPRKATRSPATAIIVLSDWHVEETVSLEQTSGTNEFSLEIAERRIQELSERIGPLIEAERAMAPIDRIVVAVLGDLVSGHIHEELLETTSLAPLAAVRWAMQRVQGLISQVAEMASEVIVITQPGNHGRTTARPRFSTGHEHSFEQNAYILAAAAESRPNVRWQVAEGYLGYLDLDGFVVRYHHGEAIRYQGGIGGIDVPVNKAITQWNKTRPADLDIFGHWHQFIQKRRFVSNGSLIGMNAYGIRIKAECEPPAQSLIVIDHGRREVTVAKRIFCDRDQREDSNAAG